jgi:hypothetical protein
MLPMISLLAVSNTVLIMNDPTSNFVVSHRKKR